MDTQKEFYRGEEGYEGFTFVHLNPQERGEDYGAGISFHSNKEFAAIQGQYQYIYTCTLNLKRRISLQDITMKRQELIQLINVLARNVEGFLAHYGNENCVSFESLVEEAADKLLENESDIAIISELSKICGKKLNKAIRSVLGYNYVSYLTSKGDNVIIVLNKDDINIISKKMEE